MEEERRGTSKWNIFKNLLAFKALSCCGNLWSNSTQTNRHVILNEPDEEEEPVFYSSSDFYPSHPRMQLLPNASSNNSSTNPQPQMAPHTPCLVLNHNYWINEEMNLASAVAAERQLRATETLRTESSVRLLEEKEREEAMNVNNVDDDNVEELEEEVNNACLCCVCMGRKKDAAFIPCGHTFCRVCARELWVNRGACPLCNRPVIEILDIF